MIRCAFDCYAVNGTKEEAFSPFIQRIALHACCLSFIYLKIKGRDIVFPAARSFLFLAGAARFLERKEAKGGAVITIFIATV